VNNILFGLFYVVAIIVIVLHYTGRLAEHNLEWLVYLMALLVFPVVLFL
jgi:low affinity Fe/Cu permease